MQEANDDDDDHDDDDRDEDHDDHKDNDDHDIEENKSRKLYLFVKFIIIDGLEKFPKSTKLHLLFAYVLHIKLKNKYKALFELMLTENNKPNLQEEFSVYSYKFNYLYITHNNK